MFIRSIEDVKRLLRCTIREMDGEKIQAKVIRAHNSLKGVAADEVIQSQ